MRNMSLIPPCISINNSTFPMEINTMSIVVNSHPLFHPPPLERKLLYDDDDDYDQSKGSDFAD